MPHIGANQKVNKTGNEDQNDTLAFAAGLLRIPLPAEPSPSFSESVEGAVDTGIPLPGLGQAEEQESEWSFRAHSLKSENLPIDVMVSG